MHAVRISLLLLGMAWGWPGVGHLAKMGKALDFIPHTAKTRKEGGESPHLHSVPEAEFSIKAARYGRTLNAL